MKDKKFKEVLDYFSYKLRQEGIKDKEMSMNPIKISDGVSIIPYITPESTGHREISVQVEYKDRLPEEGYIPIENLEEKSMEHEITGRVLVQSPGGDLGELLDFKFAGDRITEKERGECTNNHDKYFNRLEKMIYVKEGMDLAFEACKS